MKNLRKEDKTVTYWSSRCIPWRLGAARKSLFSLSRFAGVSLKQGKSRRNAAPEKREAKAVAATRTSCSDKKKKRIGDLRTRRRRRELNPRKAVTKEQKGRSGRLRKRFSAEGHVGGATRGTETADKVERMGGAKSKIIQMPKRSISRELEERRQEREIGV
ncbi:hypothetical protein TGFOU_364500 [Toxoplasma gondii FOU]|uniref:Uncharacterized protein n=2 Tax=Toxoplasma gondii TaxID=5811 RepID=A0A2G8XTX2_TOXGO|nr:hypothetical protein TGFOU_364500 [Toxoplasma gondii FOU]PIL98476.1 hypothetical protein TGCOUG_364500 [Toxoplasma gondii COUG]